MHLDLVLAAAHHLVVFPLFAVLAAEWLLIRPGLDAPGLALLGRLDAAYGGLAAAALAAGLARLAFGAKGSGYYLDNPVFWTKLALFVAIGLVSIVPTLRILGWRRRWRAEGRLPEGAALSGTRRLVVLQAAAFAALPLLGAALARGIGA